MLRATPMGELELERQRRIELEARLQEEMHKRQQLVEEQVRLRERQKHQVCVWSVGELFKTLTGSMA